jgi:hypothetical protein
MVGGFRMLRRQMLALPGWMAAAAGRDEVDLLLVLAIDASGSIGPEEFRLQREGCAEALLEPAVLSAIRSGPLGAIGIAMVEWGAPGAAATVVDCHRVADAASAGVAAGAFRAAPRSRQSWNAIGDAIDHAAALIDAAPFRADQKVIDLSGDAPDMRSRRPAALARDAAVAAGITINGLAILGGAPNLADVFAGEVIGGPGAFVLAAEGRQDFARAMRTKLVREIALRPGPRAA